MTRFGNESEVGKNLPHNPGDEYTIPAALLGSIAQEARNSTIPVHLYQEDTDYLSRLTAVGIDITKPCYIPRALLESYLSDRATLQNWAEQEGLILL